MAQIKRRIAHTKGLQDELDLRVHRTNDLVTDLTLIDGTPAFDDKYIGANAFKLSNDLNAKYADIVDIATVDDSGAFDTKLISATQIKALKDALDAAATGLVFKGAFDIGTEVAFPIDQEIGWYYKIVNSVDAAVSVDIDGINLTQGDSIFYDGVTFFKIDNTEAKDLLRDGDISLDADFTVDPTLLTDRATIKTLVDSSSPTFINESVTIATDGATLAHTPKDGVIFTGVASINNGDGTFDLVECSVAGDVLTIFPDVAGDYDGLVAKVTYAYLA